MVMNRSEKLDGNEKVPANALDAKPEAKTITNICYDCLERIFDHLDIESLLNVAGTCKRLQIAAADKFSDDFGKTCIELIPFECDWLNLPRSNYPVLCGFKFYDLKFSLRFLRCFGSKISQLSIKYSAVDSRNDYLNRYINQYCAKSLSTIKISGRMLLTNVHFSKSFQNVEKVTILSAYLGNHFSEFVNWFPNMRHLEIYGEMVIDETAVTAVTFPHLEHLSIHWYHWHTWNSSKPIWFRHGKHSGLSKPEITANILHANLQLKHLELFNRAIPFEQMLNMISGHSFILKLDILGSVILGCSNVAEFNRIASEHPLLEELGINIYCHAADDGITLIRQLDSLKRFELLLDENECDRFEYLLSQLDKKWQYEVLTRFGLPRYFVTLNQ